MNTLSEAEVLNLRAGVVHTGHKDGMRRLNAASEWPKSSSHIGYCDIICILKAELQVFFHYSKKSVFQFE